MTVHATKQTAIGLHTPALNFDSWFYAAVSDDAFIVVFIVEEIAGVIIADDTMIHIQIGYIGSYIVTS